MGKRVLPKTLFRFSNPDSPHFLKELSDKKLYFSNPALFNDPFDCRIEYLRIVREALLNHGISDEDTVKRLEQQIELIISNIGICCFSRARKNQLMWSHYAKSHEGICIGFNRQRLLKDIEPNYVEDVVYQSKHPLTDFDVNLWLLAYKSSLDDKKILRTIIWHLLKTKYRYWQYERETRLILKKNGAYDINPATIRNITFGLRASNETKLRVYDALSSSEWKHVEILESARVNERYALDFVPAKTPFYAQKLS